uniref:Uncharacterized protein n=1 Tax=Toxoplasma gondii TgCATBr9 TaxID=943120 RepID=A0A2T6IN65_TOXGO|nr:hypothetical protein TGBR9_383360 [Toxoplasma gondii TgCATBr9]
MAFLLSLPLLPQPPPTSAAATARDAAPPAQAAPDSLRRRSEPERATRADPGDKKARVRKRGRKKRGQKAVMLHRIPPDQAFIGTVSPSQ